MRKKWHKCAEHNFKTEDKKMAKIIHIHMGFNIGGEAIKPSYVIFKDVEKKVGDYFDGWTLLQSRGGWMKETEDGAVLEIHTTPETFDAYKNAAIAFAKWYKMAYTQECVRIKIFDAEIIDI